jgi:hypothetical protein
MTKEIKQAAPERKRFEEKYTYRICKHERRDKRP